MKENQSRIYKIYSRRRLIWNPKIRHSKKGKMHKNIYKKKLTIFIILIIALFSFNIIWHAINPIFEALCDDEARAIATKITNEQTSKVLNQYNYDSFFSIEKDKNGDIQMINANILKINLVISDIALNIQNALEENENNDIYIAMGSLTGIRIFSGSGPKIPIRLANIGNITTDLRSEFISQGVNQTLHRVYMEIETKVNILTPISTIERSINNQVLIAENVILGEIPSTYYNFNGLENQNDLLEMVE